MWKDGPGEFVVNKTGQFVEAVFTLVLEIIVTTWFEAEATSNPNLPALQLALVNSGGEDAAVVTKVN